MSKIADFRREVYAAARVYTHSFLLDAVEERVEGAAERISLKGVATFNVPAPVPETPVAAARMAAGVAGLWATRMDAYVSLAHVRKFAEDVANRCLGRPVGHYLYESTLFEHNEPRCDVVVGPMNLLRMARRIEGTVDLGGGTREVAEKIDASQPHLLAVWDSIRRLCDAVGLPDAFLPTQADARAAARAAVRV